MRYRAGITCEYILIETEEGKITDFLSYYGEERPPPVQPEFNQEIINL